MYRTVFRISANTFGSGNGGIVEVTAGESITLTGANSRILSGTSQAPDQSSRALPNDSPPSSKMSSAFLFYLRLCLAA